VPSKRWRQAFQSRVYNQVINRFIGTSSIVVLVEAVIASSALLSGI